MEVKDKVAGDSPYNLFKWSWFSDSYFFCKPKHGSSEVERRPRVRILPFLGSEKIVFLSVTRIDGYVVSINTEIVEVWAFPIRCPSYYDAGL